MTKRQYAPREQVQRAGTQSRLAFPGSSAGAVRNAAPIHKADRTAVRVPTSTTLSAETFWVEDHFTVSSTTPGTFTLSYVPRTNSEDITVNGITLLPATEWTRSGATLTVDTGVWLGLTGSWDLLVQYEVAAAAPSEPRVSWTPTALTSWQLNGVAALGSGSSVQLTNLVTGHQAGSAVDPIAVPSGWSSITVNATMFLNAPYGIAIGLLDSAVYADTFVGGTDANIGWLTGGTSVMLPSSSAWLGWASAATPTFWSNDGTTTYAAGNVGSVLTNTHTYAITWTVTSANMATCTLTTDGVLTGSSTQWVPTSPFIGISAGTAGASNQQQITSVTVTAT